ARVPEHELGDLLAFQLLPVPLALDQLCGTDHGARIGCPGIPRDGALPFSHAFTVAPTSANSPSWTRPAAFRPATYASSIAYSREWSVDGVVGSQPWSEVTISRSPGRSASSRSGKRRSKSCRQRWKLIGSFRGPQSRSGSTRFAKMKPSSRCWRSSSVRWIPSTFDFVG